MHYFCDLKETVQSKPNRQKFAQSGHPAAYECFWKKCHYAYMNGTHEAFQDS
jgi:hypothetical protein